MNLTTKPEDWQQQKIYQPAEFLDHPWSGVVHVYNFGCLSVCLSVCPSVCLTDDKFQKPCHRKFIFAHRVYLQEIWVKFVYEGNQVKVKVTGARKVENPYSHSVKLQSTNSGFITDIGWAMKTARRMGFSVMADQTVWPPSLSHDRKWPLITKFAGGRP